MKIYLASDKELFLKEISRAKEVLRKRGSRGTAEKLNDATNWFDAGVIVLHRKKNLIFKCCHFSHAHPVF